VADAILARDGDLHELPWPLVSRAQRSGHLEADLDLIARHVTA
jgi:hypothetical protein